ncbi:ATP-binding protein [Streptomyces sp. NPDC051976]|uniref:AlbA family DNA-binding domain-containing protein n=1 Tax=Streptomyces sp. NPDC051976 TaxID=3154947 RepID=UPI0034187BE9
MFDVRLRTLLGTVPGEASYAQYLTLIRNPSAVESTDLDYKAKQYEKKPEWQAELAKDVAALANAAGGTLILGLEEDRDTSIPVGVNPEPLTDQLRKTYREALVLRLDPPVECEIHFIAEDRDASAPHGLVVISVPPSARVPHAVTGLKDLRDGTLRFPYRNDNSTAHMNLAQVKSAIAASTALAAGRHDVLDHAHTEVNDDGRGRPGARVIVTLVPDLPGAFFLSKASFRDFCSEQGQTELPFYRDVFRVFGVGPQRFIAAQAESNGRHVAHFHADGTAAWAVQAPIVGAMNDNDFPTPVESWHSDLVVMTVLAVLQRLARHAVKRAGASGTATARLTLDGLSGASRGLARAFGGGAHIVFSSVDQQHATGRAGLLLDATAAGGSGLVQAAAALLADCYQHFGVVEAEQITHDGRINLAAWGPRQREAITLWAQGADVEMITEPSA